MIAAMYTRNSSTDHRRADLARPCWNERGFMMTTSRDQDPADRRRQLLEDIAEYLRGEFPDLDI